MQTTVCSDGDGQPVEGLGLGSEIRVSGLGLTGDSEVFIRVGVNQIGSFRAGCGKT